MTEFTPPYMRRRISPTLDEIRAELECLQHGHGEIGEIYTPASSEIAACFQVCKRCKVIMGIKFASVIGPNNED